ncbi:MAG: hypothetical protein ACRYGA_02240 [Janthinobacterium lividum]
MKCIDCKHWNLKTSPLRTAGYGLCKAEKDETYRLARTFAPINVCRFGNFSQAPAGTAAVRAKVIAA